MKILYILDFYKPNKGWIESLFEQIIEYFWQKNEISVITRKFDKKLEDFEQNWNIKIYRISAKNLIDFVFKARSFWKTIIDDIDIIHASNFYSAFIASYFAKKYKKKSILHVNGFFGNYRFNMIDFLRAWKFKILEKLNIAWNFDKYIAVSRYICDVLKFYYWVKTEKIELVYNWIDSKKWIENVDENKVKQIKQKYDLKGKFNILFYWRIEKVKNLEMFLHSIKNIDDIKAILIIHGDLKYIQSLIAELDLADKTQIIAAQEQKDIANFIKASDAVIFPSLTEAFGYVALETSLLQIPMICSEMWAIPEVVFWKVVFFNPKNLESLENAIKLAKNGKFQYIKTKKFEISSTLEKLEKIYKDLSL